MKISIILAFFLLLPFALAKQECDYKAEIITHTNFNNLQWEVQVTRIKGASTNITAATSLIDENGTIIRKYEVWAKEDISSQKTSKKYSAYMEQGNYQINTKADVECKDLNISNNMASVKVHFGKQQNQWVSSNEKIKNLSVLLLLIASIILNIVLIWKR